MTDRRPERIRFRGAAESPRQSCSFFESIRVRKVPGIPWPQRPRRRRALEGLESWLAERFRAHRGNADVVRQELEAEHGIRVSLRTVERAVKPLRQALAAEARATVRFETPPGE